MPDGDWVEHQSASGRKFYENTATREIQWKPPRRFKNNRSSYCENNVGVVLRKGELIIANVHDGKKKKYATAVGYLTNSYFFYTKKNSTNFRKISLCDAEIHREVNVYILENVTHTIRFKSKTPEIAEMWYHDICNVILNLNAGKLDSLSKETTLTDFNQNLPKTHRALSVISEHPEDVALKYPTPPGWTAKFDAVKGQYVYVNNRDYSETWSVVSVADGRIYFNNCETGVKSWLLPWERKESTV